MYQTDIKYHKKCILSTSQQKLPIWYSNKVKLKKLPRRFKKKLINQEQILFHHKNECIHSIVLIIQKKLRKMFKLQLPRVWISWNSPRTELSIQPVTTALDVFTTSEWVRRSDCIHLHRPNKTYRSQSSTSQIYIGSCLLTLSEMDFTTSELSNALQLSRPLNHSRMVNSCSNTLSTQL